MTCKNCLHYEACKGTYYTAKDCDNIALYDFDGEMYADSGCEDFADRSEWVHLPRKVGDRIYLTDGIRIYKSTIRAIKISSANTVYFTEIYHLMREQSAAAYSLPLKKQRKHWRG